MVSLTTNEARILYDWLKNQWAPKGPYADYMRVVRKLEQETLAATEKTDGTTKR